MKNLLTTLCAYGMEISAALAAALPNAVRWRFVRLCGRFYEFLAVGQRNALQLNLKRLLAYDDEKIKRTTREIFENFAITLFDFFFPEKLTVDVPERKKLEAIREKHGGVMILTFHMGHWELGARTMRQWGWPVTAVYQEYTNKKFKEVIESRRAKGVTFLPVGANAAQGVRNALKRGDMVAMLGDHPFGEDGTVVEVLGHKILWPKGPVVLAVREGAPIVVAILLRTGEQTYRAHIEEALIPQNKTRSEVDRLVQEVANKFGNFVSAHPTQWYRFRSFEYRESNENPPSARHRFSKPSGV
jgi:lauroyl/myristoyl acyltransferase